jgi:hypothetical protein
MNHRGQLLLHLLVVLEKVLCELLIRENLGDNAKVARPDLPTLDKVAKDTLEKEYRLLSEWPVVAMHP